MRFAANTRYAFTIGISLIVAGSLAGCAVTPSDSSAVSGPDPVELALTHATDRIASAWNKVGALNESRHPELEDYLGDYDGDVPKALREPIALRWAGPLNEVVAQLAARVGWQYAVVGLSPHSPILVFVDSEKETVAQVLRNVGYQAGGRASVVVKPADLRLEVVYE